MSESDSKCQQDDLAILKSQSTDCTDQSIECIVHECYNSYIQKGVDPELVSNLAKSKIYDSGSCISSYVEKLETVMDTYINLKDELSSIEQQLIREVYHDCNDPYSGLTRESTSSSLVLNTYKEQLLNVNEIIVSKYFLNSNCSNQNEQKPPKIKRKSNNYSKKDIEIIKKTMEKLHKRYNYNNINYKQKPRQNECIQQISVPSEIRFENHQPSKKYVKKLKIINISKNSIRITVKGPKSDEFKIYTGDCHKESSLLAPGMHCIQEIIFNPKSTNDYTDTLEIATENQSKIIVNLIAEHEKPILNLAKQINIGQCLIECKKIVTIKVKNTGGVSTFFITTLQNWRNKSNKEIIFESQSFSNEILIYPHMFKLNKNESGHLNIHFNPNLIQKYSEKFVILSDNCYLNEFEIYGEGVYFDITLWEDVEMTKVLNKSTIVDSSNIGFQKIKSIFIKNNRDIKIPLCWFIGSETFKSDKNNKISSNFVYEDQLEKHNCPFEINPSYAVLNSQEIVKFDIVFNPKNIGHFANIAKLYFTSNLTFNFEQLKKNNQNENIFDNENLTILNSINIMGSCVPYEIEFVPPEIYVPNEIPINTTEKLYFRVINKSESNIIFDWEFCEDDYIINISPQNGQLEKLETCVYEICISSTKPSKMYKKLKYQIKSSDQKYQNNFYLPIQAIFLSPDIIPMPSKIDMNILEIKKTFSTKLVILNKKKIQSKWNIETLDDMKKKVDINITPNNGYFLNEWQQDILIHFKFKETGKYSIHFKVFHQDIIFSYFTVNCRVNQASLIITPTTVNIIDGFRDTPCSISTVLNNFSPIDTTYKLIYANQSKLVDKLTIQPNEGTLCSNQSQKIDIEITINQQNIELNEIIRCYIGDESIPIFFIITGKVKYIDYSLEIIDSSSNEEIHFIKTGNSYQPINLILTNHSAIASKFQLLFENFHFNNENYFELDENITLTPKEKNILKHVKYVYKDINKNDRNIKTTYGVVFIMEYDSDILFPFEKKEIKIVPICDMFGVYDDKLRVQIADLEEKVISVNLVNSENVIKTIQSKLNTNIPIIRFGSMLSYDGVVKRSIKLTNTSNSYISIDWQFYNDTDKDDKLVNFSILFGDYIFPNSYEFEEMDLINGYNSSDKEKLLACFVDDYCGVCVDNIIKVDDNKTEFKPLEQKKVTFYLNPKFANLGNFNGFIKGYAKCLENITEKNVHRFRKIDTEQIQIKIHAIIWNAEFQIKNLNEAGILVFNFNTNDFIKNGEINKKIQRMKTIEIVNKTHAVYNVKINCEDECLFADNVSENFNFTLDTNKKIKIEYSNDCEKILSVLQNYYTIHADRYRANLKEIVLSTLNKTQSIPVIIKFNLPNLTISKSNVNFFNYINTTEKYEINIMNKSQYDYSFKYQIDNEEFAIELDSPKLLKNTKYNILKGNEQKTLTITHKYTSPEKISTKLVIIGFYGDCHTVRIESNASHDEKYKH